MGCSSNRDSSIFIETDSLSRVEASLGIDKFSSSLFDNSIYRYSKDNKLNQKQFETLFKSLSIDLHTHAQFFSLFRIDNYYKSSKLSLLGVLYGKGSQDEKIKVLFQNYDFDCSKTLHLSEVKALVKDLLEISCIYIPEYAISLLRKDPVITKYCMNIKLACKSIQEDLVYQIIGESDSIDQFKFFDRMKERKKLKTLLESQKIRRMVYLEFKKVLGPIAYVDYLFERDNLGTLMKPKRTHKRSFSVEVKIH